MKKKLFTIAILAVSASLVIMSCSKTSNTTSGGAYAPPYNPNTSPQTTGGSTTGGGTTGGGTLTFAANGDPSGVYSGFFVTLYYYDPGFTYTTGEAGFYNTPTAIHPSSGAGVATTGTVTSVHCNGTHFPLSTTNLTYSDSANGLAFPPAIWNVTGNTTFPSFTYTCTIPLPLYTGTNLPATVNRANNLVVPINGASGYDQIQVSVQDNNLRSTSVFVNSSATSATITADSLLKLTATPNGSINISLIKFGANTFGGNTYLFANEFIYPKNPVNIQ